MYDESSQGTEYYYGFDNTACVYRWIQGDLTTTWGSGWRTYVECVRGRVYRRNLWKLNRTVLGRTGFLEYAKKVEYINPCEYFEQLSKQPILEKVVKSGLMVIATDMVNMGKTLEYQQAREFSKAIYLDQFRLKRLRSRNGDLNYLRWLRFEKEKNGNISDTVIDWMIYHGIEPKDIAFIRDRMSELQIMNYLERQAKESGEKVKDLLSIWDDYLIMAKRSQIDVTDPIIYRARELVRRHNELAQEIGDVSVVRQAEEIEKKYPHITEILPELKKYEYADKQYKIIAPSLTEDILIEGQKLQHCIHRNDRYFERISNRESYILFLRKADNDAVPYYTLEVEPNGTVRQKRTLYNRQLDDIVKAEKFLQKWQKQLKKKLRKEDYELAERSKVLRIQEMEELRKNQVRLNGNFNGRLLADVLAEDLMEAEGMEILAA